jgi:hypothetical protein
MKVLYQLEIFPDPIRGRDTATRVFAGAPADHRRHKRQLAMLRPPTQHAPSGPCNLMQRSSELLEVSKQASHRRTTEGVFEQVGCSLFVSDLPREAPSAWALVSRFFLDQLVPQRTNGRADLLACSRSQTTPNPDNKQVDRDFHCSCQSRVFTLLERGACRSLQGRWRRGSRPAGTPSPPPRWGLRPW